MCVLLCFNVTFNTISVISWRSVYWWRKPEYPEKTSDLPQVTDNSYHINAVSSTPRHERGLNYHAITTMTIPQILMTISRRHYNNLVSDVIGNQWLITIGTSVLLSRRSTMSFQSILRPWVTLELSINTRIVSYQWSVNEYSDRELPWNCQ